MRNGAGYSVSIQLKRYGERGWVWVERAFSGGDGAQVTSGHYRTGAGGYGRWCRVSPGGKFLTADECEDGRPCEWSQTDGTCQYSLPENRKKAYDKIRGELLRFLNDEGIAWTNML